MQRVNNKISKKNKTNMFYKTNWYIISKSKVKQIRKLSNQK